MRRVTLLVVAAATSVTLGCTPISETHHRPGTDHGVATAGRPAVPVDQLAVVTIAGGRVSPPSGWLEVARGSRVTITVTSDTADEVRVSGYSVATPLPAGHSVSVQFTADVTGVFDVASRKGNLVLLQVAVT